MRHHRSDECYYRRGHWVRKPARRRDRGVPWAVLALAAVLGWGALNGCLHDEPGGRPAPTAPAAPAAPR